MKNISKNYSKTNNLHEFITWGTQHLALRMSPHKEITKIGRSVHQRVAFCNGTVSTSDELSKK